MQCVRISISLYVRVLSSDCGLFVRVFVRLVVRHHDHATHKILIYKQTQNYKFF